MTKVAVLVRFVFKSLRSWPIPDFSQNSSQITTLHILQQDLRNLRTQLRLHSKWKKTVLIIPLLASEYRDPANLPVFQNILRQLKRITYVSSIIFGLDMANQEDALDLRDLIKSNEIKKTLYHSRPLYVYLSLSGRP